MTPTFVHIYSVVWTQMHSWMISQPFCHRTISTYACISKHFSLIFSFHLETYPVIQLGKTDHSPFFELHLHPQLCFFRIKLIHNLPMDKNKWIKKLITTYDKYVLCLHYMLCDTVLCQIVVWTGDYLFRNKTQVPKFAVVTFVDPQRTWKEMNYLQNWNQNSISSRPAN